MTAPLIPDPQKAARWDALVAGGLTPDSAGKQVESEWAAKAARWDSLTASGMPPDSATVLLEGHAQAMASAPAVDFSRLPPAQQAEHQRRLALAQGTPGAAVGDYAKAVGGAALDFALAIPRLGREVGGAVLQGMGGVAGGNPLATADAGERLGRAALSVPMMGYNVERNAIQAGEQYGVGSPQHVRALLGVGSLALLGARGAGKTAVGEDLASVSRAAEDLATPAEARPAYVPEFIQWPPKEVKAPPEPDLFGNNGIGEAPRPAPPVLGQGRAVGGEPVAGVAPPKIAGPPTGPAGATAPGVVPTEELNYPRMGLTTPAQADILDTWVQRYRAANPQDIMPLEEAAAQAQALVADPAALRGLLSKHPDTYTGVERIAVRAAAKQDILELERVQQQLQADPTNAALLQQAEMLNERGAAFVAKVIPSGTAQGRDLAFNRVMADATMDGPTWLNHAKQMLGDAPLTDEMSANIWRLVNAGDKAGLAAYTTSLRPQSVPFLLAQLYKVGLIGGPPTVVKILASNTTDATMLNAYTGLGRGSAMLFDRLLQHILPGNVRTRVGLDAAEDAATTAIAADRILDDAASMWHGNPPPSFSPGGAGAVWQMRRPDFTPLVGKVPGQIANWVSATILNSHGTAHRVTFYPTYMRAIAEQAKLRSTFEAAGDAAKAEQGFRFYLEHPTDQMQLRASDAALRATFLNENIVSRGLGKMNATFLNAKNPAGTAAYLASQGVVPFARITTNLAYQGLSSTPLGYALAAPDIVRLFRAAKDGSAALDRVGLQMRVAEKLGRATNGTALGFALGMVLAAHESGTGEMPANQRQRQAMQSGRNFPESIGSDETGRIATQPFGPWGFAVTAGVNAYHAITTQERQGFSERTGAMAAGLLAQIKNESMLRGLADVGSAVSDPLGSGGQMLQREAGTVVPIIVAKLAQAMAPNEMAPRGLGENLAARIPGASGLVSRRLNVLGEVIPRTRSAVDIMVDPFRYTPPQTDAVLKELARIEAHVPQPKRNPDETPDAYEARRMALAGPLRTTAQAVMDAPGYRHAQDIGQRLVDQDKLRPDGQQLFRGYGADEVADGVRQYVMDQALGETYRQTSGDQRLPEILQVLQNPTRQARTPVGELVRAAASVH